MNALVFLFTQTPQHDNSKLVENQNPRPLFSIIRMFDGKIQFHKCLDAFVLCTFHAHRDFQSKSAARCLEHTHWLSATQRARSPRSLKGHSHEPSLKGHSHEFFKSFRRENDSWFNFFIPVKVGLEFSLKIPCIVFIQYNL